jgi:signal transduction histidine kinase/AraC-like DNA-binding protein/CheY-like chemotaxis protein
VKNRQVIITFIASIALLLSCQKEKDKTHLLIGFSQCTNGDQWRHFMLNDMLRELAYHPDLQLIMRDAHDSNELQVRQIDSFINEKIDLLIVSPNESAPITAAVEKAFKSGIPVIVTDRKINSQFYSAYLGADNREIGKQAGNYVAHLSAAPGKVFEIWGLPGSSPARERHDGFVASIAHSPNITLNGMALGAWSKEGAASALPDHEKEIRAADIIFAHNDVMALAAWEYCEKLGISWQKKIIGVDGLPGQAAGLQWVSDGILTATMLYPTGGEEAIRLAAGILSSQQVKKENLLQSTVIDWRNVRVMQTQAAKIMNQQASIEKQQKLLLEQQVLYRDQKNVSWFLLIILITATLLGISLWKALFERRKAFLQLEVQKEEIIQQRNQIIGVSQQAEEANNAQLQFFTNISHEFRTPLTLILGAVEGLITGTVNTREAKFDARLIRQNSLRLLRLINQLMDFRKIENGKMKVRASEHNLTQFVSDIVKVFEKNAIKRNIDLHFFDRDGEILLWFDENMLDKVIFNLLSNAFSFTPGGGKIQVSVESDAFTRQAIIRIGDNGKGMSKEYSEQAFERFFQAEKDRSVGNGLGLALSKELVDLHHGEIMLWSEKNVGTRFEIRIPFGNQHFTADQIAPEKAAERAGYDEVSAIYTEDTPDTFLISPEKTLENKKNTLLIVDDNAELREFLCRKLSVIYTIKKAADSIEGLKIAFETGPDLIITDINMPGNDGLQFTKIIKSDIRTTHIPVIILTAKTTMEQKIEGIRSGADAYMTKPFHFEFLNEVIKNLLNGRAILRERFSSNFASDKRLAETGDPGRQFAVQFTRFMEDNFANQGLSVEHLGQHFGLSRVQLYRKVKKLFGESVNDYIQHVRLKKGARMLLETDLNVSEIAYKTGYSSPGYFATAFRGRYHCTPGEYREQPQKAPED